MSDLIVPRDEFALGGISMLVSATARRILLQKVKSLKFGELILRDGNEAWTFGSATSHPGAPRVEVDVIDPRFYGSVVFGGTIGSGEAYMHGFYRVSDLSDLIRLFVLNRDSMLELESGWGWLMVPVRNLMHRLHRNSIEGSKRNIRAHYDLGNDFYRQFLDETMTYSSGIFQTAGTSLRDAQVEKVDRLCRKLQLSPGDHLLEIGTGWGFLATHAAKNYGCRVTTTTISSEQHRWAEELIQQEGLSDRVTLLKQDYRELQGTYDKIVSVEMIEAVGHQYFDTFFRKCSNLLAPHGMLAMQAIVIRDDIFEQAAREVDFIKHYIFPGCCIPSVAALSASISRSSDMRLHHAEDFSEHYAHTLRLWNQRFQQNWPAVRDMGFNDTFRRMWEFYLCYCEGGFRERSIGVTQLVFQKPMCRQAVQFPALY